MDLRDFLTNRENKNKEYYWAVVLEPGLVQAGVWEITGEKASVVAVSPPAVWEGEAELIGAVDTALSSGIQTLPEGIKEPSKTVFGLSPTWINEGQIKEEFLAKIKKICVELSLEPTGFVVLPEAVAHLEKVEEGSPLSAAVVGMGKDFLEITVFNLGNLIGTTTVARSVSVFEDVVEGLSRFSALESLPSRIILYDGKEGELNDTKELLVASEWETLEKIKFLHTPKIETLTPEKKVIATALAGAAEIGGVTMVEKKEDERVKESKIVTSELHQNLVQPENGPSVEELGFVMGEDVAMKPVSPPPPVEPSPLPVSQPKVTKPFFLLTWFKSLKGKIKIPFIGVTLALSVVGFFLFWWFYPKADIKIFVSPKRFEEKTGVTIGTTGGTDLSVGIIAGEIVTTEVAGEKTKATTGTKRVGEKAKGSVKIQNGTASVLNLTVGTVIVSAGDLKFNLVATASVSAALSPSTPGTQVVEITAADIGAEYNLAKDEIFKIANYPKAEVDGVAVSDFTGGSSREISAVAADDLKVLDESLTSELTDSAKKNLSGNLSAGGFFVENSLAVTPSVKNYSSKLGDEAANLKLALTLKAKALVVKKEDLVFLAKKVLEDSVPSGFALRGDDVSFDFTNQEGDETGTVFDLRLVANFLPVENLAELIKQVTGKKTAWVENRFSSIPGFTGAQINIRPKLPGPFNALPRISKNIKIEILSER